MLDLNSIHSLSDFNRNSKEHIERLRQTGQPEVLTVNGKAQVVIQDAEAYQQLLKKAEFADTAAAIHRGIKAHARGEGKNMRKALEDIARETGFQLQ